MADENVTTTERKQLDWERIEAEYRAGKLSVREVARRNSCSEKAIRKRAKADGWTRNLSTKIDDEVRSKLVRSQVRTQDTVSDQEIVRVNAEVITSIIVCQREDIKRARAVVSDLFEKITAPRDGDTPPLPLPVQVDCAKKLADATKTVTTLERDAWGIKIATTEDDQDAEPLLGLLQEIMRGRAGKIPLPTEEEGGYS